MENQNYKNENTEREFLNNCEKKKQFLKVKNSLRMRKQFYSTERQ